MKNLILDSSLGEARGEDGEDDLGEPKVESGSFNEIPESLDCFRVERELGSGGMGRVFLAHDDELQRPVAIKLVRPDRLETPAARKRFQREARTAAQFDHPNIVRVHHFFRWRGQHAIVMEYVEGRTLREVAAGGRLPLEAVVDYGKQILSGLVMAHGAGFVHRDLKSANVMVTPGGRVKILDFGLAKRFELTSPATEESAVSPDSAVFGTPHTMAPEQAAGEDVDHRTDLFAFGVLLYELTTGVSPFRGETLRESIFKVLTARQPPACDLRSNTPEALSRLIDRLLAKDPDDRPDGAESVLRELEGISSELGDRAVEPLPAPQGAPSGRSLEELRLQETVPDIQRLTPSQSLGVTLLAAMVLGVGTLLIGKMALPSASPPAEPAGGCRPGVVTQQLAAGVRLEWIRVCSRTGGDSAARLDFLIGRRAVSVPQLGAVTGTTSAASGDSPARALRPVAVDCCSRLGGRLPTAQERRRAAESPGSEIVFEGAEWSGEEMGDGPLPFRCVLDREPVQIGQ